MFSWACPSTSTAAPRLFAHPAFGQVRIVKDERTGEPWFVAKDVCDCLGLTDVSKTVSLLDDDERGTNSIRTPGGLQAVLSVSEPGLYSLILRSRKPEAKAFKRWITHEVLPAIRKTGEGSSDGSADKEQPATLSTPEQAAIPPSVQHSLPAFFEHEAFGKVRVITDKETGGEPWFVAADVCDCLELGNPRSSLALLDEDEKGVHTVDTLGGNQQMATVSEPGLYSLILRSRKPEAKAFKRWITHEVLPAIRKTGGYIPASPDMTNDEIMSRALLIATDTINAMPVFALAYSADVGVKPRLPF